MRRALRTLALVPYAVFFLCVLCPVAVACYGAAALARTAWANLVAGWREHG